MFHTLWLLYFITLGSASDYRHALKLSLLFYEAQRSGPLPASNRITWRSDSALNDHGHNNEDLTGGYYDASDFIKFSFTMAFTTTILSWGMLSFGHAYKQANQYQYGLDAVKWATDYFIKCHTSKYEFYGQVGDFSLDHAFWGRPEEMNMSRPAYKIDVEHPGSDLAGEVAAALAAASLLFENVNKSYSEELLRHSGELYDFATKYRGLYHDSIPGAKIYYESTGYGDELTWAAIWLYKKTKDVKYIEQAETFYTKFRIKDRPNEFFYNKKVAGIQLLLAEQTLRPEYISTIKSFCDYTIKEQVRTPKGLIFIDKSGTLSHAANVAFICLQVICQKKTFLDCYFFFQAGLTLNISQSTYVNFAKEQINYMLGSTGQSFVVGYGQNYPKQPHHSASSCPNLPEPCGWKQFTWKGPNPQILYGALVSGPDLNDHYEDVREEFLYNEVTLDYNAGFQSALAGLIYSENENKL
ncbi:endoglucanase A-like isoform X1 [Tribolium madens]|uniref:endoglucanase A-like isoform X1 n=1 Tax=Tribolium madens TaxID=41895 RepID=UPI001CF764A4|nr:endoglucanase A-like isoform X1 [Tribolium madens]